MDGIRFKVIGDGGKLMYVVAKQMNPFPQLYNIIQQYIYIVI